MQRSETATGVLLAFVCLGLLGVMPIIANSRPAHLDALGFAFAISVWQSVFAAPLVIRERRRRAGGLFDPTLSRRARRRGRAIALFTGALFGLSTWLYVLGVERAGAANAAIAIQAYPVFAILLETLFLNRRKTPVELGLTGLLLVALYYLGTGGSWAIAGLSPWFLVAMAVPLLWSVAHVIIREQLRLTPATPAQITFLRVVVSSLFLGALLLIDAPQTFAASLLLNEHAVLMGLVYYLELIFWFSAVRHIDVSLASSITTPWPALTMGLAALILGDAIALYQVGALIAVVTCVALLTRAGLQRARAEEA